MLTLSNLQEVNATTYTATFTGNANTDISNASASVTPNSWQAADGSPGGGSSTANFIVDTVTPTVAATVGRHFIDVAHDKALVTFTFSEAPTAFSLGDTGAVGGRLSKLHEVNATTYEAIFTGAENVDYSHAFVRVAADTWLDVDGNLGAGAKSNAFTVDTLLDAAPNHAVGIAAPSDMNVVGISLSHGW